MTKSWILAAALTALLITGATAQQVDTAKIAKPVVVAQPIVDSTKLREAAAVRYDQAKVASDKMTRDTLQARTNTDRQTGTYQAVKADRKAVRQANRQIMQDRMKRDMDKVKKVL